MYATIHEFIKTHKPNLKNSHMIITLLSVCLLLGGCFTVNYVVLSPIDKNSTAVSTLKDQTSQYITRAEFQAANDKADAEADARADKIYNAITKLTDQYTETSNIVTEVKTNTTNNTTNIGHLQNRVVMK